MTRPTDKRSPHLKSVRPKDPNIKSYGEWFPANQDFYKRFRRWLKEGGYSDAVVKRYGTAARIALGWLDKPYYLIDPQDDLDHVRTYITSHYESKSTRATYLYGIGRLEAYLRLRCHKPASQKQINWDTFVGSLPSWLAEDVRTYVAHCRRAWVPEQQHETTLTLLSHATLFLRWAAGRTTLNDLEDLTPALWFEYLDQRLEAGISPATVNVELSRLQDFLRFLAEQDRTICQRTLRIESLKQGPTLPRDVPLDTIRRLWEEIEKDANSSHGRIRYFGVLDRAWFLSMVHCGLRTCEVRRLQLSDLDLDTLRVRVEQSKGLKDRVVFLSQAALEALKAYLALRGSMPTDHVFIYHHQPLTRAYCRHRLHTYSNRCGVHVTPHQLRHTCATLLINAGAPVLTVQAILGHKHIDTTLGYTRLYDATVAADYYRAINQVETRMELEESETAPPPDIGQLLALLDSLQAGTLNETQRETVSTLRAGLLALAGREHEAIERDTENTNLKEMLPSHPYPILEPRPHAAAHCGR
jgi:integrase/recombinase XerD